MIRDWLIIATAVAVLWGLWLLLHFVFDQIEQYHAAWREAQADAEAPAKPKKARGSFGSR
jgi:hypothetical protein